MSSMTASSRAWLSRLAAAVLVAASLTVATPAAQACACGGVVDRQGFDTTIHGETAVVVWDGKKEAITVGLDATSEATDAGLLIPTPVPAEAALGEEQMFLDLEAASAPKQVVDEQWFGPPVLFGGDSDNDTAGAPQAPAKPSVQVLRVQDLGPLEATILKADNPKALTAWLRNHKYRMGPQIERVVQPYIEDGWAFAAVRLTTEGTKLDGELPPIELSFASKRAIYPMRMSQGAEVAQQTRTYVLAPHQMKRKDRSRSTGSGATLAFAGSLQPGSVSSAKLRKQLADTPYLTTIDQSFPQPADQVRSDFVFTRAANDQPFQQVITTTTYRVPIDVAILGLAVITLLLGALAGLLRRRFTPTLASRRRR